MIISFVAGFMFNINYYLPMIGCVICCIISCILSVNIKDFSKYNYFKIEKDKKEDKKQEGNDKTGKLLLLKHHKFIILVMISYAIFTATVAGGQTEGKLYIQDDLAKYFTTENLSIIMASIICISRVVRVIANISFNKIYIKYKDNVSIILSVMLLIAISLLITGYFITISVIFKIVIMTIGYILILFVRDPFKVYIKDIGLNHIEKENSQTFLTIIEMSRKISRAITSIIFTMVVIQKPILYVMYIVLALAILQVILAIILLNMIKRNHKIDKKEQTNYEIPVINNKEIVRI